MPVQLYARINNINQPRIRSINYGRTTLRGSSDLNLTGIADGDVIAYNANTETFVIESVSQNISQTIQNYITNLDAGFF